MDRIVGRTIPKNPNKTIAGGPDNCVRQYAGFQELVKCSKNGCKKKCCGVKTK